MSTGMPVQSLAQTKRPAMQLSYPLNKLTMHITSLAQPVQLQESDL